MSQRTWTAFGYEVFTGFDLPCEYFYLVICKEGDAEKSWNPDDTGSIYSNLDRKNPSMTFDEVMMVLRDYNIPTPPTLYEDLLTDREKKGDPDFGILTHDYGEIRSPCKVSVGTIGSRPCEIILNKLLVERRDKKLTRRVMSLHMEFKTGLKHLSDIQDKSWKQRMLDLWRERCLQKLASLDLPDVVRTHLGAVLTAQWRAYLRENKLVPNNTPGSRRHRHVEE